MFFILKFPIYTLGLWPFYKSLNLNYIILIHLHKLHIHTIKFTNFLSIILNYKLKFYKILNKKSSRYISLINKSNIKKRNQKGLGKARVGSLKSSISKGGGVIFGPHPRFINLKINTKEWVNIYKSFILNKRYNISWFSINRTLVYSVNKNFIKTLTHHLGISSLEKIIFLISSKSFVYRQNYINKNWNSINISDFLNTKYIIYLI